MPNTIEKRKTLYIFFSLIILIIGAGVSIAYFIADNITQENVSSIVIKTGSLEITFNGSASMSLINGKPGDEMSKTITIENTGQSTVTSFNLNTVYMTNDFINDEILYSLSCSSTSGSCDGVSQTVLPRTATTIYTGTNLLVSETRTYVIKIKFLDSESDQNYNQTKELSFNLLVNEGTMCSNNNLLSCKILSDNGGISEIANKTSPSFSVISPSSYSLYEGSAYQYTDGTSLDIAISNLYIASAYTFSSSNGYVLTSPTQVSNVTSGNYDYYYTCYSNSATSCLTMYQISPTISGNYMTNYKVFQAKLISSNNGVNNQLYSMSDPNGTSYYYRGSVTNNYVTFAGLTWRIVRINGDGTIRLLLNDYAKDTNSNYYSVAYNSSSSCNAPTTITQAVDCAKYGTGTYSSTSIKTTVDTWYSNNITGTNDSYVATGKYCNDYSYTGDGSGFTIFSGWQRIANLKAPSLSCTAASGYTGGGTNVVQAKAGLISADELAIAGGLWETANTNVYYYIDNNDWITLTSDVWYGVSSGMTMLRYNTDISNVFNTYQKRFKPVINLNANVLVTGTGTLVSPYQITGLAS